MAGFPRRDVVARICLNGVAFFDRIDGLIAASRRGSDQLQSAPPASSEAFAENDVL
jgi:hypothetical protein